MNLKLIYFFRIFLWGVLLASPVSLVSATGFGISPSFIEFKLEEGSQLSRQVTIFNTGAESANFVLKSNLDFLKISPESLEIAGKSSGLVTLTATGKKSGEYFGEAALESVEAKTGMVSVSLGTAINVSLFVEKRISNNSFLIGFIISASIVISGLLVYAFAKGYLKKLAVIISSFRLLLPLKP